MTDVLRSGGQAKLAHYEGLLGSAVRHLTGVVHRTPVLHSRLLNELLDCEVYLKAEMYQRTGSFKFRGAFHRIATLENGSGGVVAHSSGNYAQAVALAAKLQGTKAIVVMPTDAPMLKIEGTKRYGADIVFCGRDPEERSNIARTLSSKHGFPLLQPYDDEVVIAGQATAAYELLDDVGELDALLVPLGGGGLLAGSAIAVRARGFGTRVVGVEPSAMPKVSQAFASGEVATVPTVSTVMDGQMIATPGDVTFPIIYDYVDDVVTVDDCDSIHSVKWLHEFMKVVAEPSGASALAALMSGKAEVKGKVGIILSGGNVGAEQFAALFASHCN